MTDVTSSVISLFESDTVDSVLIEGHDPTCLKSLLGWGTSAGEKRIFRLQKETPIVIPCILLQVATDADAGAPGSVDDLSSVDTITISFVAGSGSTAKKIWKRAKDLMRVGPSDPIGARIFLASRGTANELYDEGTKSYRWVVRYRIRSIEST
jgi:hypothetical protein